MNHHHGLTIKEYRTKQGLSVAALASRWPGGAVSPRYVQRVESGERPIARQDILRALAEILDIPLWCFGLSEYNPFSPASLPGHGRRIHEETLVMVESLIQQVWLLRESAPLPITEKSVQHLLGLFHYLVTRLPPPSRLEPHFLRLYAQAQSLRGVIYVDHRQYVEAAASFKEMHETAEQLGEPTTLAHSLMNMGTEAGRAGKKQEAVDLLERARDVTFSTSKALASLICAYLARAYASNGEALRFERTIDTAQTLSRYLQRDYSQDDDFVFHPPSGILAERSYGYVQLVQPNKVLALRAEIERQIEEDNNTRLRAWIPLDWAQAYLMLGEVEESVREALELFRRAVATQSPHIVAAAHGHLIALEEAGYMDVQAVRDFREELRQKEGHE